MFLRHLVLLMFLMSLIFPYLNMVFASSEITFDDPTFGDISATAAQTGTVNDSYPIAGDTSSSSEQYCIEKNMFLSYYTVAEPSAFGTKAAYESGLGLWETTPGTTKLVSQITCSTLPVIGISNAGGSFVNNYWDTNFPGTGSGSIGGIVITANVAPTLNMTISTGSIALGELNSATIATGSLNIEVGTNAVDGVVITARSGSGGLTNTVDNAIQINDLVADGIAETYKFSSTLNAISDSNFVMTQTAALDTNINENSTEHVVYTSDKPEAVNGINDVIFTVSSQIDAQTPAGEYQDTVTFTVTGTF